VKKLVGSFALVAVAAAFAGAGAQAAPATHRAQATDARAWATQVCSSVGAWQKQLQRRSAALNHVKAGDLPGLKRQLVSFLSGVVGDTDVLVTAVDRAGAPSVPHGSDIQRLLHDGFAQTRSYFVEDVATAKLLPVSSPSKFAAGAAALGKAIGRQGNLIGAAFDRIDKRYGSTQLDGAIKPVAACAALG
jgi:hypothetical protein